MWRSIGLAVLLLLGAALLVGCGGGGGGTDSSAQGCNVRTAILLPTSTKSPPLSVEEASKIMGFDLLLPTELPPGITAAPPFVIRGLCPNQIFEVDIRYGTPGHGFALIETKLGSANPLPDDGTPIRINNADGRMRVVGGPLSGGGSKTPPVSPLPTQSLSVSWRKGDVTIVASADPGGLPKESFLKILESMPD